MATNQNNIHTNSFTKGMNTDTSLDMVSNEQYVFGQNIRITNNALLNAIINSNTTEGIVSPVPEGIPNALPKINLKTQAGEIPLPLGNTQK